LKKYELIIFDCDGTLVDSETITNALVSDMMIERGINISPEQSHDLFAGKTINDIINHIRSHGVDQDADLFEEEYRMRSNQKLKAEVQPIPGVIDLIETLDIPYCVASNGPKIKMDITLPSAGLGTYFGTSNIFSAYDINVWKPEPDLFLYVAGRMGVEPDKALVIEDTVTGVIAAQRGHIDVWAYNPHLDTRLYVDGVPNFSTMSAMSHRL